jgi:DNA-directed RNA polymerase subunit beta'
MLPSISTNDWDAVRIRLASPADIRSWSSGEVKHATLINPHMERPEENGLFCERIFGPEKACHCACGKLWGAKHHGIVCDRCGDKTTFRCVPRNRMGHIELAAPVVHIWFFSPLMSSGLGLLLDMKLSILKKIIYFQSHVVVDPGDTPLKERQLLTEDDYLEARARYGSRFDADMGAEAIRKLLRRIDLDQLSSTLRAELKREMQQAKRPSPNRHKRIERLKLIEALRDNRKEGPEKRSSGFGIHV